MHFRKIARIGSMFLACGAFCMAAVNLHAAPLTVTSVRIAQGSSYTYNIAITDNTSADPYSQLISVDFTLPLGTTFSSVTAPAGNGAVTDPGAGFIEFSSNALTGFPVGTTVGGFRFVSPSAFQSLAFTANYLNLAQTTITTFAGTTTAATPEPASLTLLLLGGSTLLGAKLRSRRSADRSVGEIA